TPSCTETGAGGSAAAGPALSSAMMRRMEANISSIEGSYAFRSAAILSCERAFGAFMPVAVSKPSGLTRESPRCLPLQIRFALLDRNLPLFDRGYFVIHIDRRAQVSIVRDSA